MSKSAFELMDNARASMMVQEPFYASLSLHLELVADNSCKTAWTDGKSLGFNEAFVIGLTPSERRGLVAHEVAHCAKLHMLRRGNRDHKEFNEACDYSINAELIAAGFNLPKGALLDPKYDGMSEEEIYNARRKEKQSKQDKQQDGQQQAAQQQGQQGGQQQAKPGNQPSQGQGAGNAPQGQQQPASGQGGGQSGQDEASNPMGEFRDAAPGHDKAAATALENEWKANVRQALAVAKAHGAGKLPGHLQSIDEITIAPRIDWKAELRRFIDESAIKLMSWGNPNRRFVSEGLYLPGKISDGLNHLAFIVDDSSSIDLDIFNEAIAEIKAALDEGAADKISVVFCNTAVHRVETYEVGDEVKITVRGSGGTKFAPAFAWLEDNAPDVAAAVYLTDLDSTDFGPEPAFPVIWAAYGNRNVIAKRYAKATFGELLLVA